MLNLTEKKGPFNLVLMLIGVSFLVRDIKALNCWQGTEGGSTPAADAVCGSGDTCKASIVYSTGFLALPTTTLSCVTITDDTDASITCSSGNCVNQGCANCAASTLTSTRGCVLNSADGTTITYCAQVTDGNKPQVTSCFQGTFLSTNVNGLSSTTCTPTTTSYEFCKLDNTNNQNAPVGTCATTCTTSATVACCNANGCNKPLVCYTGTFYVKSPSTSNYVPTVCSIYNSPSSLNLYCKVSYSYTASNGIELVGSCESACTSIPVVQTSTGASGTYCCSENLCNKAFKLYLANDFISYFYFLTTSLILLVLN